MLQWADTDLFNSLVSKAHNNECQILVFPLQIKSLEVSLSQFCRFFHFYTLVTHKHTHTQTHTQSLLTFYIVKILEIADQWSLITPQKLYKKNSRKSLYIVIIDIE